MPTVQNFWEYLFAAPEGQGQVVQIKMRLLKKAGQPFLLLPSQARPAAASMALYPAQTGRARIARALLHCLLRASLPLGTETISLAISPGDAFVKFLASLACDSGKGLPVLGIFAGNPASDGQRFLLLVFDANQRPVAVVKAGLTSRARALVEQEERFRTPVPIGAGAMATGRSCWKASSKARASKAPPTRTGR